MREDQREWQDAVRSEDIRRQKEEKKLAKGALDGWDNPDVRPTSTSTVMSCTYVMALTLCSGCPRSSL